VIASGQPAFVPEVTEDMLFAISRDELEARELRELGIRSWIAAPLVARGKTLGAVSMIMSGCRRYRQSDVLVAMELGRRAGIAVDNARLYREAKDAVRVRDGVLATVSHDLRSPLGAIELATTLLVQSCGAQPGARGQIEAVRRSVDRMARLIDDLLDMASIDAGRLKLRASQEDARSVLEDVVESFAARASERRIELACECEQAQLPVVCDRSRIARVFENIIGNALKFCRAGERVVVHAARDGERIRVVVRDTGPGIRREDLPHIFEPYWSARDGTQRRGVGLGLFISKGIVEAHSGELAVDSEEGRGTTFTVTLPVAGPATTAR
jgi:signal transduction histidine kinase